MLYIQPRDDHGIASIPAIFGDGFMAQGIAFENTASSDSNQAVALLCSANYTIFYQCRFLGHHDTLYAKQGLQFYRDCDIYGTVDFIFGFASAVFQICNLYARMSSYQKVTYTAQGRSRTGMQSGFTLQGCKVTVSPEVGQARSSITGFLGRPWFPYSTVVVMESFLDSAVDAVGWEEWPDSPVTCVTYLEFRNWGPGADTSRRVRWPGHKVVGDESDTVPVDFCRQVNSIKLQSALYYEETFNDNNTHYASCFHGIDPDVKRLAVVSTSATKEC